MKGVYMSVAEGELNGRQTVMYERALKREGMHVAAIYRRAPHLVRDPLFQEATRNRIHADRLASLDRSLGGLFSAFGGAVLLLAAPLDFDGCYDFDTTMQRDLEAMHDTARVARQHDLPVFAFRNHAAERAALERMHTLHLHTDETLAALDEVATTLPLSYDVRPIRHLLAGGPSYAELMDMDEEAARMELTQATGNELRQGDN